MISKQEIDSSKLFAGAAENALGFRDVRPQDLSGGGLGVRLIDVREPGEFNGELGHVPGAELVPLGTLPGAAAAWPRDGEVLLICRSGGRSARAAQLLGTLGFRRVMNLAGGMLAYNEARLPVARG